VIVDNSETSANLAIAAKNIIVIENHKNLGIATALNQGVAEAKKMGYTHVLMFDQDSEPTYNIVSILVEAYNAYQNKEKIGALGINFPAIKNKNFHQTPGDLLYREKDYLITSGTLIPVTIWEQVGKFEDSYFIDNVDLEYSLKLRKNGKVSLITNKCGMKHDPGTPIEKMVLGMKVSSSNHNAFRRYYMARNHYLLSKKHLLTFPYFILKLNYFFFLSIIKIIMIEDYKKEKLKSTFRGLRDAIFEKN